MYARVCAHVCARSLACARVTDPDGLLHKIIAFPEFFLDTFMELCAGVGNGCVRVGSGEKSVVPTVGIYITVGSDT